MTFNVKFYGLDFDAHEVAAFLCDMTIEECADLDNISDNLWDGYGIDVDNLDLIVRVLFNNIHIGHSINHNHLIAVGKVEGNGPVISCIKVPFDIVENEEVDDND